ncbi:RnfH family protein [Niveibacterium sp. 24ML]|uniref:RnfH family protein n=1 Tax=Niveibacterium sp. 24ML TaxID=2985512 RepID=UPI002B4BBFF3|nr:RnfH family protein [Niveibacterium sp. 24ML]
MSTLKVAVAYTEKGRQAWHNIEVPEGTSVKDAIELSGIYAQFPHIDLASQRVGIFGKAVKLDAALRAGDRVEIYRPIQCDPMTVPRRPGFELENDEG